MLAALALAGCGGSGNASGTPAPPKTANGQPATLGVANENLGKILVDSQGRTLYLFQKDSGTTSTCTGACATDWPPLRANGKPTVGSGANASMVATSARSDGKPQVTYNGHPLYLFAGDQKPGDTNGQGLTRSAAAGTCCPRRATKSRRPWAPAGALATRRARGPSARRGNAVRRILLSTLCLIAVAGVASVALAAGPSGDGGSTRPKVYFVHGQQLRALPARGLVGAARPRPVDRGAAGCCAATGHRQLRSADGARPASAAAAAS